MSEPLVCPQQIVDKQWIDYKGHLNMAYYNVLFDRALDHVLEALGIGITYIRETHESCFTLEAHVTYLRELMEADPVQVSYQLLDMDNKRLHLFGQMYHAKDLYLAATSEQMMLQVDLRTKKAVHFAPGIQPVLRSLLDNHSALSRPEQAGHVIGIRR